MKCDDGYVAYLNGQEVARANAPAVPGPQSQAERYRLDVLAREFEDWDISPYVGALQRGPNVLAIHVLNRSADDDDVLAVPELHIRQSTAIASTGARHFADPSPGAANGTVSFAGLMAPPSVRVAGGLFGQPF